MIVEGSVEKEE